MMGVRVVVQIDGLEQVLSNLNTIEEKASENLQKQVELLAKDTQQTWQQNTHRRSGLMQSEERTEVAGLSYTLNNTTKYYDWVNDGHMTPRGWHRKRGYVPAKRRSHVEGQQMTQRTVEWVAENAPDYLSKFLDF